MLVPRSRVRAPVIPELPGALPRPAGRGHGVSSGAGLRWAATNPRPPGHPPRWSPHLTSPQRRLLDPRPPDPDGRCPVFSEVDALEQQLVSSRAAASEASDAKAQQSRYESLYARYRCCCCMGACAPVPASLLPPPDNHPTNHQESPRITKPHLVMLGDS